MYAFSFIVRLAGQERTQNNAHCFAAANSGHIVRSVWASREEQIFVLLGDATSSSFVHF
jgi:hypothetical protein